MSTTLIVDKSPGEVRAGRFDNHGRALALYLERRSEERSRARRGALYCARVRAMDAARNAAFVDLGLGAPGFLPLRKTPKGVRVHEGAALAVTVRREAIAEKGPVLAFAPDQGACAGAPCPSLLAGAPVFVERIRAKRDVIVKADREGRERLDAAFAAALEARAPLPGGGALWIEPTRALVSIDVDTAQSTASAQRVNEEAIAEILRQLDLRGLGGNIAIDFAAVKGSRQRKALESTLAQAIAEYAPAMSMAPLSRFGVAVLTRPRQARSLAEIMLDEAGNPNAQTTALAALRALENAHLADPARALSLQAPPEIIKWLQQHAWCWAEPLSARLGGRLNLRENTHLARDQYEVIAQ